MSGVECGGCGRKSDLFLCSSCGLELQELLTDLACGWQLDNGYKTYQSESYLDYIGEEANGQSRKGESARRSNEKSSPALCRLNPNTNAVAADSFKGTPNEVIKELHALLAHWVGVVNVHAETLGAT